MRAVAVDQYTLDGEFVKTWSSLNMLRRSGVKGLVIKSIRQDKKYINKSFIYISEEFNEDLFIKGKRQSPDDIRCMITFLGSGRYKIESNVVNMSTKVTLCHTTCGHTYDIKPTNFINRGSRCAECAKLEQQKTTEEFKKQVYHLTGGNIQVVSEYTGAFKKVKMYSRSCGHYFTISPTQFLKYPFCNKHKNEHLSDSNRKKKDDVVQRMNKLDNNRYNVLSYTSEGKLCTVYDKILDKNFECIPYNFLSGSRPNIDIPEKEFFKHNVCKNKNNFIKLLDNRFSGRITLLDEYKNIKSKYRFYDAKEGKVFYKRADSILKNRMDGGQRHIPLGEQYIMRLLDSKKVNYIEQYRIKTIGNKGLVPDFYLPEYNAFIEFDGQQHYKAVDLFGGEEGLRKTQERDALKNAYAYEHGIKMIRIPYCYLNHIKEFLDPFFAKNEPIKKQ